MVVETRQQEHYVFDHADPPQNMVVIVYNNDIPVEPLQAPRPVYTSTNCRCFLPTPTEESPSVHLTALSTTKNPGKKKLPYVAPQQFFLLMLSRVQRDIMSYLPYPSSYPLHHVGSS
jgi:hypothetical protein